MDSTFVTPTNLAEAKVFDGRPFPLTLAPSTTDASCAALCAYIAANRDGLQAELDKHACILFRGFDVTSAQQFNDFVMACGKDELPYIGGAAPRTNVCGRVFTSNESPPSEPIPFHHEMAQVPKNPSWLWFFCEVPSKEGGETPLCLSNVLYRELREMHPEFVDAVASKGLTYTRVIGEGDNASSAVGRGWQSTFLTSDRTEAERIAATLGVELHWLPDGSVKTVSHAPGVKDGPNGPVFFNQIVAAYFGWVDDKNTGKAVTYGDGTPLPEDAVNDCLAIMERICVAFRWEAGDILLVDNVQAYHSRRSFVPPRRLLAALAK